MKFSSKVLKKTSLSSRQSLINIIDCCLPLNDDSKDCRTIKQFDLSELLQLLEQLEFLMPILFKTRIVLFKLEILIELF